MADPPSKRCCFRNTDSYSEDYHEDSVGPDGVFPSETDGSDNDDEHYFFPSEDSLKQTIVSAYANDIHASDSSVSDNEVVNTDTEVVNTRTEVGEELTKIGNILISPCCDKFCLRHLTAMDVIDCKSEMAHCETAADRKKWLFSKLADNSSESSKGMALTKYFVAGKEICTSAWCHVFSVSRCTLQRMQQRLTDVDRMEHGNAGKKRQNTKTEAAIAWMERYFNLIGDKMPDKDQIHLPCWENQKDIYYRYRTDLEQRGNQGEILGISMFYKVWGDSFSKVVIPEVSK